MIWLDHCGRYGIVVCMVMRENRGAMLNTLSSFCTPSLAPRTTFLCFFLTRRVETACDKPGSPMTCVLLPLSTISRRCYHLPRVLPVGGRGPYAVGIATEHIRTPVAAVGDDAKPSPSEEELWPLELMAQVIYPRTKSMSALLFGLVCKAFSSRSKHRMIQMRSIPHIIYFAP